MIIKTTKELNGVVYNYTYSDLGMKIERDGALYDEAYDPLDKIREYTETDIPVPINEEPDELIEELLGGTKNGTY